MMMTPFQHGIARSIKAKGFATTEEMIKDGSFRLPEFKEMEEKHLIVYDPLGLYYVAGPNFPELG